MFEGVAGHFGLNISNEILTIANGTANKNYIVKDKVNLDKYVIRQRNPRYSSENQMLFEEEYLQHIYLKGIPVSVPLKVLSGQRQCWIEYKKSIFQIYPYIDGDEFDCDNDKDVEEGGRFLGKLHSAVNGYVPETRRVLPRYDDPLVILREITKTIDDNNNNNTVEDEEKETLNYILSQVQELNETFTNKDYEQLPKLLIHGDYHPANVKYINGTITGLFDFDWVSLQPRLRDITDGIIYFASRRNQNITGDNIFSLTSGYTFDITRSNTFVQAYCKNVNLPLLKREIKYIPHFIKARLIYSRVQALPKIPKDQAIKMLTIGLKPMLKWIDKNSSFIG